MPVKRSWKYKGLLALLLQGIEIQVSFGNQQSIHGPLPHQ